MTLTTESRQISVLVGGESELINLDRGESYVAIDIESGTGESDLSGVLLSHDVRFLIRSTLASTSRDVLDEILSGIGEHVSADVASSSWEKSDEGNRIGYELIIPVWVNLD